jgi:hypothetical protein
LGALLSRNVVSPHALVRIPGIAVASASGFPRTRTQHRGSLTARVLVKPNPCSKQMTPKDAAQDRTEMENAMAGLITVTCSISSSVKPALRSAGKNAVKSDS